MRDTNVYRKTTHLQATKTQPRLSIMRHANKQYFILMQNIRLIYNIYNSIQIQRKKNNSLHKQFISILLMVFIILRNVACRLYARKDDYLDNKPCKRCRRKNLICTKHLVNLNITHFVRKDVKRASVYKYILCHLLLVLFYSYIQCAVRIYHHRLLFARATSSTQ